MSVKSVPGKKMAAPQSLSEVLELLPDLREHGINNGEPLRPNPVIGRAVLWISANLKPTKRIVPRYGSYVLKHLYENARGEYIANGQFIAAALMAGLRCRPIKGSPNVVFNVNVRSIKAVAGRVGWGV